MTDAKIPKKCRNCKHCKRYSDGLMLLYDWVPWEWKCDIGKQNCEKDEVL